MGVVDMVVGLGVVGEDGVLLHPLTFIELFENVLFLHVETF